MSGSELIPDIVRQACSAKQVPIIVAVSPGLTQISFIAVCTHKNGLFNPPDGPIVCDFDETVRVTPRVAHGAHRKIHNARSISFVGVNLDFRSLNSENGASRAVLAGSSCWRCGVLRFAQHHLDALTTHCGRIPGRSGRDPGKPPCLIGECRIVGLLLMCMSSG